VIAQALLRFASEGGFDETELAEETALDVADDVVHALHAAGHKIITGEIPAELRLLAAVRATVDDSGIRHVHLARTLGLTTKHLSALLTGKTPLSISWAEQIVAVCGRTLDIRVNGETKVPDA
jgi:hypothetical protein